MLTIPSIRMETSNAGTKRSPSTGFAGIAASATSEARTNSAAANTSCPSVLGPVDSLGVVGANIENNVDPTFIGRPRRGCFHS